MPEDTSDRASKVYDAMKSAGMTTEDRMRDADAITKMVKLPKGMVLSALQELEGKGYAKRRAREKAARYYLIKRVVDSFLPRKKVNARAPSRPRPSSGGA